MEKNHDEVLDKVRKLLRLSKSANQHEAAAALRQAQKLIEAHGLTEADVAHAQREAIGEESHPKRGHKEAVYRVRLANLIADAFGVSTYLRLLSSGNANRTFTGPRSRAVVACYAFAVLLRQMERDRRLHLKRVRVAKNRAARGDAFCIAWVGAVRQLVGKFAGVDESARINKWLAVHVPGLQTQEVKPSKGALRCDRDMESGFAAGAKARLNHGVPGGAPMPRRVGPLQLEGPGAPARGQVNPTPRRLGGPS